MTVGTWGDAAPRMRRYLIWTYVAASASAISVTFFLVFLGLGFTLQQWLYFLGLAIFVIPAFTLPDIYMIVRHFRPVGEVMEQLDRGETPGSAAVSRAIVRALNLPFLSFVRVTLFHGPAAAIFTGIGMYVVNQFFNGTFQTWQILGLGLTIFFFASPAHAIFEFFIIARRIAPEVEKLWPHCARIEPEDQRQIISIKLKSKLLYMSIFVNSLPLFFLAATVLFKSDQLFVSLGASTSIDQMLPLFQWVIGVVIVCTVGTLAMSVVTASEVSRSAASLAEAMQRVEQGDLSRELRLTATDEYAELFRGFNLMLSSLREEVRILALSHDLAGELNLDVLLSRIMHATAELLDADRSTLFLHDKRTGELFSRVAVGLETQEIRIAAGAGIAGAVFTSRQTANISDPYNDPRFNKDVDRDTGYRTESILAMPIVNKTGDCIGVTQVLNKKGDKFSTRDEVRLGAFTAQVAVALENAKLFEDVLNEKNYNDSILRSTSNGIITLDAEDHILTANDAATAILQLPSSALLRRPATEVFGGANAWILATLDKVRQTGHREIAVEMDYRLGDKDLASVNLGVNPLIDINNEERLGSMLVFEDITEEKRIKSTMARYMSPEVAEQLIAAGEAVLGGRDQKVSILFSDVRNFTTVSEALGARETVSMLNEYFERMVDVVFSHRGVLDKFIGDAIMALFGVPFNGERDADDAVKVANEMFVALRLLNRKRAADGKEPIDIGVGISTGVVVVGNIGSPKRMEYTVIGDSVNLASRLEGVTKYYGVKVLISEFTRNELKTPTRLREIDLLRVKGKHEPVAIFEALDHYTEEAFPAMERALAYYGEGVQHYRAARFADARACFAEVLALHAEDTPSRIYLERCTHFAENPPPSDWDGVWTMTSK